MRCSGVGVRGGLATSRGPIRNAWSSGCGVGRNRADQEADVFAAGEFISVAVFDRGGERWPKINEALDFVAFFHKPHYAVVEVAPVIPQRSRTRSCSGSPKIDESQDRQIRLMLRDLGTKRQPAMLITIGSHDHLPHLCWMLHRRDLMLPVKISGDLAELGRSEPSNRNGSVPADRRADGTRSGLCRTEFGRVETAGTETSEHRQGCAVRVRHRSEPRITRAVPVSFYIVAMLFIMFDIEIIFLYPYAVSHGERWRLRLLGDVRVQRSVLLAFVYEVARAGPSTGDPSRNLNPCRRER